MSKVSFATPAGWQSRDPITAANYREVCQELHDKLIEAGLVATADTGQLDFSSIASLTSSMIYGYRTYKFDDGLAFPVYLKIRFGTGGNIVGNNLVPWNLRISIGLGTNGAGGLTQATAEYLVGAVGALYLDTSKAGLSLTSLICMTDGFLGVSWKQGAIQGSTSAPATVDGVPLASFFICRDTDDSGAPTADGVSLVVIAPGGILTDNYGGAPLVVHLRNDGDVIASSRASIAYGSDVVSTVNGKIPLFPMYTFTPAPRRLAQLLIAVRLPGSGLVNDELDSRSVGTELRHFIAMKSVWPADVFTNQSSRACIAMLWE